MDLKYDILGDDMQAVVFKLQGGQKIRAEVGAMLYMNEAIKMDTGTGGGIMKGLKRMIAGESFFITTYESTKDGGQVAFSGPFPGKITPMEIKKEKTFICQGSSYLCSTENVGVSIAFTKRLGAGFFGGEGFILQKIEGEGIVFLHAGGTTIEKELKPGEEIRVDTGCIIGFDSTVNYDIKYVGGIKTAVFGGEGLFFATLKGPGKIYLQTLPFSRLADRIIAASRTQKGEVIRGGNIIGGIIGGDH